jgi:hypothetical protein
MIRWIQDQLLAFLQKRCYHPGEMRAVDILEGSGGDIQVAYCRRCGAVRIGGKGATRVPSDYNWRAPDPNLWRGA